MLRKYIQEWSSSDLVFKLSRVKDTRNIVSTNSKIVKRLRRQKVCPMIIDRTIGLVLGPSEVLFTSRSFLEHGTLINKVVGTICQDFSNPLREDKALILLPCLLVGTTSALGPELAFRCAEHSLLWRMSLYVFDILFYSP